MLTPNTILQGRYRIVRQLGQGGMGTVYEAIDERFDSIVALKETFFDDERLRKAFEREAYLLNSLRHSALTRVTDYFNEGAGQFLVMEFIRGEDLAEMMQRRAAPFSPEEVAGWWGDQLLDALDYLHNQQPPIIHRDIKPQNLKLTERGQIILLDFGLAKGYSGQLSRITSSGSIFGYTPNYAPLEQIQGSGTDPRSDLYSLAATLYHLMTGITPPDVLTRASAVLNDHADPLRLAHEVNAQIPRGISEVLGRAMALKREQRPATAREMRAALRDAKRFSHERLERPTEVLPARVQTTQPQSGYPLPEPLQPASPIYPAPSPNTDATGRQTSPIPPPVASQQTAQWSNENFGSYMQPASAQIGEGYRPVDRGRRKLWPFFVAAVLAVLVGAVIAVGWARWSGRNATTAERAESVTDNSREKTATTTQQSTAQPTPETVAPTPAPTPPPPAPPKLNVIGTWTGSWGNSGRATLVINNYQGDAFTGTLTVSNGYTVALTGRFDPDKRSIFMQETKILKGKSDWSLGTNNGTVTADGKKMSGKGKDKYNTYRFSLARK